MICPHCNKEILARKYRPDRIEVSRLAEVITDHFGITLEDLKGTTKRGNRNISFARHILFFLCRKYTNRTNRYLAKMLGLEPSSISWGVMTIRNYIDTNDPLIIHLPEIERKLSLTHQLKAA